MQKSVLEAIKQGEWDYEPAEVHQDLYDPTGAMPGTPEKLSVLAKRIAAGLPLWHAEDRRDFEDEI